MSKAYVIFKKGSKQYRAQEGEQIDVDLLDAEEGSEVNFDEILFVGDGENLIVGQPAVQGYQVKCKVVGEVSGPKITSIKYKPSHNQVRKFGHRQRYTRLQVEEIVKAKKRG